MPPAKVVYVLVFFFLVCLTPITIKCTTLDFTTPWLQAKLDKKNQIQELFSLKFVNISLFSFGTMETSSNTPPHPPPTHSPQMYNYRTLTLYI